MHIKSCMFLFLLFLIAGCASQDEKAVTEHEIHSSVEWADIIKWEDVTYYFDEDKTNGITEQDAGEALGKISFQVMYSEEEDNPDYQLSNGEATWLAKGVTIQAISGEPYEDYIFAAGKVYKAEK